MVDGMDRGKIEALIATRQTGFTLPQPFYLDRAIYAIEIEQIWRTGWLFVAHDCEIPSIRYSRRGTIRCISSWHLPRGRMANRFPMGGQSRDAL